MKSQTIPNDWILIKNKYLFNEYFGGSWGQEPKKNQTIGLVKVIRVSEFEMNRLNIKEKISTIRSLEIDELSPKLIRKNDLILEKSGGGEKTAVGRAVLIDREIISPTINSNFTNLCRPNKLVDPKFLVFSLNELYIRGITKRNIKQTTGIQNLDIQGFMNEKIYLPPLNEQKLIAKYLDKKTQKIDLLNEKIDKKIKLLKEKRSSLIKKYITTGLNSSYPDKWIKTKIKYVKAKENYSLVDGPFGSDLKSIHYEEDGEVIVIESGFITKGIFKKVRKFKKISLEHFQKIKRSSCEEGDIIIAKIGEYYGMSSILPDLKALTVISGNSCKLKVSDKFDKKFIHYSLLNLRLSGFIQREVNQTGQPFISLDIINSLPIRIPIELEEQKLIVKELETNLEIVDELIEKSNTQTKLVKEYRESLISSVVTGKIRISEDML